MAYGEAIVGAILQVLFDRLASLASPSLMDFVNRFGERSFEQTRKWRSKLKKLEHYLVNAEQRQLTEIDVKKWLDDLRDLSYDLEDLLDELETEALERRLKTEDDQSESSSMIQSFISDYFNFKFHDCVKDITCRLDDLFERVEELNLVKSSGDTLSVAISGLDRPASTSLLSELAVLGRDEDKRKILDMVIRDDSDSSGVNFQVISIVGMGGIGKTTLAQVVYNDESLMGEFTVKAWVCISQDFDVLRISKAILEAVNFLPCDLENLDPVQQKLKEKMAGQKFLLVLDDVWDCRYHRWDALKPPFMAAAPGSKIIVTTRDRDVASTVGSIESYYLKCLPDHDCWKLFCKHSRLDTLNGNKDSIRDKVVKRCKGLPLAAKALGGLLLCKHSQEWKDMLDSEIWELPSDRCNILPVLRLSYQHLPSHLKRCFAYCAILPEDYEFEEQELVLLWMAEGFIHESEGNKQIEDLGSDYFANLVSRSFFQQSRSGSSKYIMHDLVNDLAKWASGDMCFRLEDEVKSQMRGKIKNIRHSSFIHKVYDRQDRFQIFHEAIRLRTFLPFSIARGCYISNAVVFDLLPKLKRLRALSFQGYNVDELPDSIGDLKHMRYFNLANTLIKSIPESISRLLNLETLILKNCLKLLKLPFGLGKLINLRYLDIKGAKSISEMPLGMDNLKSLRTLSNFVVGKGACSTLKVLKNLELRNEEFRISGLENMDTTKDVQLNKMARLKVLVLEWNSRDRSRDGEVDKEVLNVLQPHTKLEELTINSYHGKYFFAWLDSSLFTKMKVLVLNDCGNCTSLPSLGQLCSLRQLTISAMQNLKSIGPKVFGDALEILRLHLLPECELWEQIQENEHEQKFSHLRELSIRDCTNLSGKLPPSLPSLVQLDIKKCPELVVSLSNLSTICYLKIDGCKQVVCSCPLDSKPLECLNLSSISEVENCLIRGIQKVRLLEIKGTNCEQVINFWRQDKLATQNPLQGFQAPICVSELCINGNCPNLVSIPKVRFLPTLTKLKIKGCSALISLTEVLKQNLESLEVEDCHSLKFIARGMIPRCLRRLNIRNCKSLQCVFEDGEASSTLTSLSNVVPEYLTELKIEHCTALTSLAEVLKHNLESLEVKDCHSLKFIARGMIPWCLRRLNIWNCKSLQCVFDDGEAGSTLTSLSNIVPEYLNELKIEQWNALTSLAEVLKHNLESLEVKDCHSLKFIAKGIIPRCLRRLTIRNCKNMQCVFDDGEVGSTSTSLSNTAKSVLEYLKISGCESLLCLSSRGMLAARLKHLEIWSCSELTTLSSQLPKELQTLEIGSCGKLESIAESLHNNTSLETIIINDCENLKSIPDGLHDMCHLRSISVRSCPNLDSFPREGLVDTVSSVEILNCEKLQTLPNCIHMLSSLQDLTITGCPRITSFPEEGFPTNLSKLKIGAGLNIHKQMIQWMQNLTSLRELSIHGDGCEAVSFPEEDMPMMFPASLTYLGIIRFKKLEYLSSGIENLTSLKCLWIFKCPNFASFPKGTLPSSLLSLWIVKCPLLLKRCERGKGQEWHKIAHIPRVMINP